MPTQEEIYKTEGDKYEALIAREDYQGNILKSLREITPLENRLVLDLGAGTGRLAGLLAPHVRHVRAFDVSEEMLRVCRDKFIASGRTNWQVDVADHRKLPVENQSADLVVSGWSVSYLAVWNPDTWREELESWLSEMKRVLRPNSFIVLFESLGTGNESPIRLDHLKGFYPWLDEVGFQNKWIRTDYKFVSLAEAEELSRFFFGDELGNKVVQNNWVILPECTGVWWLKV
ncbi:MAG TPA: class I SAM-dependent methyltransferase [Anaerolineales bacterium]|nr:class I SAM-dependent methyltransferase [Anaerolineales bacterium]HNB37046.1 class I SAM-dependent methyltransferase [Anaerolineales bacterium]HNC08387.1 class I SAM-dependent methyltransferase [Anaerolineales bacterium]